MSTRLFVEECFDGNHKDCKGYNGPADNPNFRCDCACHKQPAEDERNDAELAKRGLCVVSGYNHRIGVNPECPGCQAWQRAGFFNAEDERVKLVAMFTELYNCYTASKCAAGDKGDREEFLRLKGMAEAYQDAANRIASLLPVQPAASTPTEHCPDCVAMEKEGWEKFNEATKAGIARLRCEKHRAASSTPPPCNFCGALAIASPELGEKWFTVNHIEGCYMPFPVRQQSIHWGAAKPPTSDKDELHFEVLFPRGVDRAIIEKSVRALLKNAREIEVRIDHRAQSAFDAAASTEAQDERKEQ